MLILQYAVKLQNFCGFKIETNLILVDSLRIIRLQKIILVDDNLYDGIIIGKIYSLTVCKNKDF